MLVLFALSALVGVAFGSIGLAIGLRTGNGEAVQGVFPLMFVLLFLSSGALPRDLIDNDWFQIVATINPVSYLIEGFRSLFITGWDGEALALAFGVALGDPRVRHVGGDRRPADDGWSAREPVHDQIRRARRGRSPGARCT